MDKKGKILFLVAHRKGRSPGQRFRFEQYLDYLEQNGFEYTISYLINEKDDASFYSKGRYFRKFWIFLKSVLIRMKDLRNIADFDAVFIYRDAIMIGSCYFERRIKRAGIPIILDFDDAIWLQDVSGGNENLKWLKKPSKTAEILKLADMAFVGNSYLSEYASKFNSNVKIVPTTLETDRYKPMELNNKSDKICIGWTGSLTTIKHFDLAIPFLKKLQEIFKDRIYVKVISDAPDREETIDIVSCKWSKESEVEDLAEIDIGIMPLPDDDWARGKCAFKGLQYMALGIPAVMSPVGVNVEIVDHGTNGFLAATDDEWVNTISNLIESEELRKSIGKKGRLTVLDSYSFDAIKDDYLAYYTELLENNRVKC